MEQPDHLDELLRRRLQDAELKPPAFVWPNIENALRKRKRRFFLWYFAALGLTITSIAAIWLSGGLSPEKTAAVMQPEPQPGAVIAAEAPGISNPEQEETASLPSSKSTGAVPGTQTDETGGAESASTEESQKIFSAKGVKTNREPAGKALSLPSVKPGKIPGKAPDKLISSTPTLTSSSITEPAQMPESTSASQSNRAALASLYPLPLSAEPLHYSKKTAVPGVVPIKKFKHKKKDPKACYDFSRHPSVILMDVYAGPSFAFKELSTNDPEYKTYLNQRLDTEHRSWAFNAGLRATLLLNRHFLLRTGLHYDQMIEIFEYAEPNSLIIDFTTTYVNGIPKTDTTGVRYGEAYFKAYNRFGMLDIPLQAGVELRKGRTGFNVNAGVSFNILFWKRGAILTTDNVPRYFTPSYTYAVDVFQPRTSLSAVASIQWFYHVQPRLRVFAEPYFRQIVQPVTVEGYPVWQRYGIGGVKLGVTKILD